jgi:hypothetical protein
MVHFAEEVRTQDDLARIGTNPLKGRIGVAGDRVPARFYLADRTFDVRGCHPDVLAKIMQMMRKGQVEALDVNLSLGYVPGRAYLALLRIAYLTMFKALGYL